MTIFFFLFCWWKRPRVSKSLQSKRFEARRKVSEWRLWCCFVVFDRHSNPENMDDNSITFLSLADVTNWLADHHAFFVCFLGCGCLFALCLFFALVVFSVVFFCFVSFFILASWQLTGLCTGPTSVQLLKSTIVKMDDVFALIDRICTGLQRWWSLGNHLNSSAGYFPQLGALWLCTSENLLSRSAGHDNVLLTLHVSTGFFSLSTWYGLHVHPVMNLVSSGFWLVFFLSNASWLSPRRLTRLNASRKKGELAN